MVFISSPFYLAIGSGSSLNRPPSAGSAKPVNAFVRKARTSLSIGRGKSSTLGSLSVPNSKKKRMKKNENMNHNLNI